MIELLLLLKQSFGATCGGEILPDGMVCCNNSFVCGGSCIITEKKIEVCVSDTIKTMCYDYMGLPVSIAIALIPNIICAIIGYSTCRPAPFSSLLTQSIASAFVGIIFFGFGCGDYAPTAGSMSPPMGLFGAVFFYVATQGICDNMFNHCACRSVPQLMSNKRKIAIKRAVNKSKGCCDCCACACCYECSCNQPPNNFGIIEREMKMMRVGKEDIINACSENFSIPPTPKVRGQGYHISCDSNNIRKVYNNNTTQDIPYTSWQEDSEPLVPEFKKPITVYYCTTEYIFDSDMDGTIKEIKQVVKPRLTDEVTYMFLDDETVGITTEILYSDHDCCAELCGNPFTNCFLYTIIGIFGFGYIADTVWRQLTDVVFQRSVKRISGSNIYRARAGERDHIDTAYEEV